MNRYGYAGFAHYDVRPGGAVPGGANEEFKAAATRQPVGGLGITITG